MSTGYAHYLQPLKKRFYLIAVLLLAVASAWVQQQRNRLVLEKTNQELLRAKSGLGRVAAAIDNRRAVLTAMQNQFAQGVQQRSPEAIIYGKVDELKARFKPDDMTITPIEKKGYETTLNYTLTFTNPDYNTLLNSISALQGAVFPMTPVSSVAIAQTDLKGSAVLSCKVTGRIVTGEAAKP